jgi:uncharacterized protein (TIGR02270 family)
MQDSDAGVRAEAIRAAGALGKRELWETVRQCLAHGEISVRAVAFHSATLLGDREERMDVLRDLASTPHPRRTRTIELAVRAIKLPAAHTLLQHIATNAADIRLLIGGAGAAGDPHYVPWLIKHMDDVKLTRLAGEAFSMITGLDLAYLDLERKPPENFESGPNDNPDDPSVDLDPDDGLPCPDPAKCAAWWNANKHQFRDGVRSFMGKPPTREHCIEVLRSGYQRQRIAAAQYLCLLAPGTPLFNTSAPAWRQKRWLAKMG